MPLNIKDAPYNAVGNGTTDDTSAIQDAIDDAVTLGEIVFFPAGTYLITETLQQPYKVTLSGEGGGSIIKVGDAINGTTAGKKYAIEASENFWLPIKAQYFTVMENILIDATDNTHDITLYNTVYDFNCCVMESVSFIGNKTLISEVPEANQTAFHAYHTHDGTDPSDLHNNVFRNCSFRYLYGSECVWFEGNAAGDRQANNNYFENCRFGQYHTAARIEGIKNVFFGCVFNEPEEPAYIDNSYTPTGNENPRGSDFRLVFTGGRDNVCERCWFEVGENQVLVRAATSGDSETAHIPFYAYSPNNSLNDIEHVADVVESFGRNSSQNSSVSVIVSGVDLTSNDDYEEHAVFRVNNGSDGNKDAILDTVSYSSPDSTVTFKTANSVTANNVSIQPIFKPTKLANNQFRMGGDVTSRFAVGELAWVETDGEIKSSDITISIYNGVTTKVTIADSIIGTTLENVWPTAPTNRAVFVP